MPLSTFLRFVVISIIGLVNFKKVNADPFDIVTINNKVSIFFDGECALDSIAANLLASDIERVSGYKPFTSADLSKAAGNIIIIGSIHSGIVRGVNIDALKGKWECYGYRLIHTPTEKIKNTLVICGSDFRGTAYGVFDLSARLGVSPWYWWADVTPVQQKTISIDINDYTSDAPSVKYRGIFINDEDWGLQPWAAKTFEPETGDIGPKTYAKVFELLLRLKANLIWPAMHPSTKAFFHYPGNVKTAADYQIIIGSSHAEPMLRNNVGEWKTATMGHFNYLTNKDTIYKYWEDRVKESSHINAMYTLGMRGVHDSGMEGVKTAQEAVPLLQRIFDDQRALLAKYVNKEVTAIPQVFTAYKEVLDIYDNGLQLPEDVTLVWPDDNYGYIQRLNNEKEKTRAGGSGVYYHASYWGRPHDYLWLSTTHPGLIREEMMKAYEAKADRIWVLNVGDIKPLEYNIQLFMDMAFNAAPFKNSRYTKLHLLQWLTKTFPADKAQRIRTILWPYYQLAFERRPEFMGWSQTEPTTKTTFTAYNHFSFGDEAQRRIDDYERLEKAVKTLREEIPAAQQDAFYQLVYYPVMCASWMNKKFLCRDKAYIYAKQNRISAYYYAQQSSAVYDSIVKETTYFNEQLRQGKWKGILSMKPRDLPVFQPPQPVIPAMKKRTGWEAIPEGYDTTAYANGKEKHLPTFVNGLDQTFFIDIFLTDSITVNWKAIPSSKGIQLSAREGKLSPNGKQSSFRLWVEAVLPGTVTIEVNGKKTVIKVNVANTDHTGFVESNGLISIYAQHCKGLSDKWNLVQGLGHTDVALQAVVTDSTDTAQLVYEFYSTSHAPAKLSVYTLPTHPLYKGLGMRYGVRIDNGPLQMVDFRTIGRSEEWKQNVLRNEAIKEIDLPALHPGKHTITMYAIDPGVILDRMLIRFGNVPKSYSVIPETRKK